MTDSKPGEQEPVLVPPEKEPTPKGAGSPAAPERPSFQAIFQNEFAYVCRSLLRFGVPRSDVDDVAHDVFVAVHSRLADFDPTRPLRPWLFAFAARLAAKYRERAIRFGRPREDAHEIMDPTPNPDEQLQTTQSRSLVLAALESIEESRRAVFILHELDGQSMPDIAAALEIPLNTAYSRLRLARDEFRAAVARIRLREEQP